MTASTITVKLSRGDNTSWGFRLQGGKDFSTPLSVQRVSPGSLADNAGLLSGDGILKIGGKSTENLKHKEAQDCILRSGNNLEIVVQRGGMRIWKPTVTPVNDIPGRTSSPTAAAATFTKTSLAANKQETAPIGSKHNVSPRPFANLGGGKLLVNNQYNTPAPLYSMNNIAETLSAHTEVLASGAKGINFMKEAQPVNTESAVYRMIMEENQRSEDFNHVEKKEPTVTQHVSAPVPKPISYLPQREVDPNACVECGKSIVGVFVRIKGKSMHPDCFRCSTCGTSLKNVGYFNVNDKLYCDMHAKQAARVTSTTPTYEPCTLSQIEPPTDQTPAQAPPTSPAPQTPVSAPLSPIGFRSISPTPFHRQLDIHRVEASSSPQPLSSPPIFKSTAAPPFTVPTSFKPTVPQNPAPVLPTSMQQFPSAGITTPHTGSTGGSKFVWPPPKNPPTEQLILVSNTTPAPPSYRPPPETQHVTASRSFKYQSSMSPPLLGSGSSFGTHKVPPATCPKPHVPVQGTQRQQGQAAGSGHHTWTSTTSGISSTSVIGGGGGSGFMMSPSAGARPAPRKGKGQLKAQVGAGSRIPICAICGSPIRGPFVTALSKTWCPEHFICANNRCQRPLIDIGFIENDGALYCEICYEMHLAPICAKCTRKIKGDCLKALDKQWHPECFLCAHCHKPFGRSNFYMEDGKPYCEKDWNDLFTTKCVGCGYPIEAGDRWVEALNNNYHSQCFKCMVCHKNLENQNFYAVKGRPHCKAHAR